MLAILFITLYPKMSTINNSPQCQHCWAVVNLFPFAIIALVLQELIVVLPLKLWKGFVGQIAALG